MSCADNSSYISALGLGCAQHKRLVCTNLRSIGLSPNQVEEILVNCPASCNVSPCKEDDKRNGELHSIAQNISDGDVHSASPGTKKTTHLRAISKMSRNLNEFGACFPGWDPSCQDDSSYLSPIGLGCTGFQAMGCDVFSKVGFTAEEVKELKSRCPCSCQEACPSPTALPSSTPSTASPTPAPTISPSWHPTSSPTATPTRIPSPYPTRTRPTPMPVPSPIPTNEPTVSQQPSVSFAPTPSPTTSSQLNRLPNKPIGASNGSADGALIDQNNGNGLDFSIHQLVIICVSFCAFVAFGIALFLSVKRNSQKWKERREKRMSARRKRLQATKKKVRRKLSTFKKSRRGVFASSDEFSANNKRKNKKKTYTTKRAGSMRGLALPTRKKNVRGPSSYRRSYRQDSFDSSDSSDSRHRQERRPKSTSRRRDTHNRSRKQKKANVYKGAEFLKPVSRGGKKDLCMAAIDKVDSAINEKFSREYEVESQSDLSGDEGTYTSAEKTHRVNDLTLSGDDRTKINQKRRGMMGELAAGVADDLTVIFKDAADDLTLIFK